MDQSAATPTDPMYELSTINNFDAVSPLLWDQWYFADQPSFPDLFAADGGYSQHELGDFRDFIPDYIGTPALTELTGSIFSQEYSAPQHISELTNPEKSPNNADRQLCSLSIQSEKQNLKPSHTKRALSSQRNSTKNQKAKAAAAEEVHVNTKERGSINEAIAINHSSPPFNNNIYTRKVKERNRRASYKVRAREREVERKLESAEKDIEQINRDLSACATDLTHQVHNLKMQLLQHVDCDCVLIQEYIASEARRYLQDRSGKATAREQRASNL